MKKVLIIIMLILACISTTIAESHERLCINRDYVELDIQGITDGQGFDYCKGIYDSIIIHGRTGFDNEWNVNGQLFFTESITLKEEDAICDMFNVSHTAGNQTIVFGFTFWDNHVPYPFSEPLIWKRQGESIRLHAESYGFSIYWSTGDENTEDIDVINDTIYTVTIVDTEFAGCVNETFQVEVRDNVELTTASTNLMTNLNEVHWNVTTRQATYIQFVNVYRNGQFIATVPYTDGVFVDDIGSEAAPWQYHLVAVSDGVECPIPSYWARTISMSDLMGTQGTQTLQWTEYITENPTKQLVGYGIYDYVMGQNPELRALLGSFVTMFNYDQTTFDGYATVAAVLSDGSKISFDEYSVITIPRNNTTEFKDTIFTNDVLNTLYDLANREENLAFSNRTTAPLNTNELKVTCSIFPNPARHQFTVSGIEIGIITLYNSLGQVILTQEIRNETIITVNGLTPGTYIARIVTTENKVHTQNVVVK